VTITTTIADVNMMGETAAASRATHFSTLTATKSPDASA